MIEAVRYESPCGELLLGASGGRLVLCDWVKNRKLEAHLRSLGGARSGECTKPEDSEILALTARQLDEYFAGTRRSFDVPLGSVGTGFQCAVWNELTRIEWGQTVTYGRLAHILGHPQSVRAVAAACGANPISILVPCHRVVSAEKKTGAGFALTGYAGGLEAKKFLLAVEHIWRDFFVK